MDEQKRKAHRRRVRESAEKMAEIHREALGRLSDDQPTEARVTASSGNVFADIGCTDPDLLLAASEAYGLLRFVLAEEEVRNPGSPYCRRVAEACDRLQAAFRAHGSRADAR